ncbi:MAG TPA: 50S ribosomal protein L18 [Candidatus Hypogeohydataceae bacterium YC38]|nr:50S ribosomal protein L18 [Candidatus Brocadiales bacterium]
MNLQKEKWRKRERRHLRVRQKVYGTKERPRLAVYKSLKNIYCQLIDDSEGNTLVSASTLSPGIKEQVPYGGNKKAAELVGQKVAEEAKKLGIEKVVFDRSWYKFHGRVKALADAARKGNLRF